MKSLGGGDGPSRIVKKKKNIKKMDLRYVCPVWGLKSGL